MEVAYKGTNYNGFQIQQTGNTIQGEVEKALTVFLKETLALTGSSRTDSGVHALQNYFHFDWDKAFARDWIYNLNAILPADIVIRNVFPVADEQHCRFDAVSRSYQYRVYDFKNPFIAETAYFYPYPLDTDRLSEAAALLKEYTDFSSFSKKNTQVKTFQCQIKESFWSRQEGGLTYHVTANRFLRGMVRALVATMLKVGRGTMDLARFRTIIETASCGSAYFDAPARGLTLVTVAY